MRGLAVVMLLASAHAHAQPADLVGRPLVLARGELEGQLTFAASARPGRGGEPASLSPDAWFGVTRELTVGIVHSARSLDEIDADRPFCLTDRCEADYRVGLDARYAAHRFLAPRMRVLLRDTDPWKPAITLGALVRWTRSRFAITSDPYLRLGLANRDRGNRAAVMLPVQLAVQPTRKWMLAYRVGYDSALAVARDGWRGQMGFLTGVHPIPPLEVFVEYAFPSAFGPQHDPRERTIMITAGWRQSVL